MMMLVRADNLDFLPSAVDKLKLNLNWRRLASRSPVRPIGFRSRLREGESSAGQRSKQATGGWWTSSAMYLVKSLAIFGLRTFCNVLRRDYTKGRDTFGSHSLQSTHRSVFQL